MNLFEMVRSFISSRQAVGPTLPLIRRINGAIFQMVKLLGLKADYSH